MLYLNLSPCIYIYIDKINKNKPTFQDDLPLRLIVIFKVKALIKYIACVLPTRRVIIKYLIVNYITSHTTKTVQKVMLRVRNVG